MFVYSSYKYLISLKSTLSQAFVNCCGCGQYKERKDSLQNTANGKNSIGYIKVIGVHFDPIYLIHSAFNNTNLTLCDFVFLTYKYYQPVPVSALMAIY